MDISEDVYKIFLEKLVILLKCRENVVKNFRNYLNL